MARKLKNWLKAYLDWTLPRSESPESMVLWAGLFTIAATVKRKVCFPRSLMGSYEIYPNLYCIFVGQPGVVRKSTTAGYAEELLLDVNEKLPEESITFSTTATSPSKLIEQLAKAPDGSITVISSEFSSFIGQSREAMYEFLTDIFDGKRKFEYATRSHGLELSEKPVLNLLAATTPAWVARQPPEHFLGGGFASRVIFVFEQKRRQYKMYYDDINYKAVEFLGNVLAEDLADISSAQGEFKHDSKETRDAMEAWYVEHAKRGTNDPRIAGYYERKHVHAHKVAMLLSLAESNDLVIRMEHFEAAKHLLGEIEEKMPRALATVGSNPLGQFLYDIMDFIKDRGEASKKQVMSRFIRDVNQQEFEGLIQSLAILGEIEVLPNAKDIRNPTYRAKTKD